MIPLAILSIIIAFVPQTVDNIYLVPPLAFCMGLVTTAFGDYFRTKHTPFLREGFIFVSLLSSFVLGVVFSAYLTIFYHEKTILGVPIMMSVFYLSMLFASWQKKVKEKA
ncbi:ABC transporter ATP-binding protein [Streptococcus pneumoniae]|nr:ABC transporter ATP-binding protein [Streptococcus pneumoniae]